MNHLSLDSRPADGVHLFRKEIVRQTRKQRYRSDFDHDDGILVSESAWIWEVTKGREVLKARDRFNFFRNDQRHGQGHGSSRRFSRNGSKQTKCEFFLTWDKENMRHCFLTIEIETITVHSLLYSTASQVWVHTGNTRVRQARKIANEATSVRCTLIIPWLQLRLPPKKLSISSMGQTFDFSLRVIYVLNDSGWVRTKPVL